MVSSNSKLRWYSCKYLKPFTGCFIVTFVQQQMSTNIEVVDGSKSKLRSTNVKRLKNIDKEVKKLKGSDLHTVAVMEEMEVHEALSSDEEPQSVVTLESESRSGESELEDGELESSSDEVSSPSEPIGQPLEGNSCKPLRQSLEDSSCEPFGQRLEGNSCCEHLE